MTKNRLVKIVEENLDYRKRIRELKFDIRILSSKYNDLEKKYEKLKKEFNTLLLYYTLNEKNISEMEFEYD